ncbi:MAG: hypothetical protein ACR2IH_03020 [Pyrinomonadaceae bacterium]
MSRQVRPEQRYRGEVLRPRRPFWLPASNYYVLAVAAALALFFLVWGILQDGHEESPFIGAGIVASGSLIFAVFLREVVLRRARERFLNDQRRLDRSIQGIFPVAQKQNDPEKLTLEKNAAIISEIRRKSDAAKVLGKFGEGHREVFDMCVGYLAATERELPNVGVGSPRLAAFHKGKELVNQYRHFHLLQWAEIEAKALTQEASGHSKIAERLEAAEKALGVVDFALKVYPREDSLLESESALKEFVASIKLSQIVEKAERSEFKGNHTRALSHYKNALFFIDREGHSAPDHDTVRTKIEGEIRRIREITAGAAAEKPGRRKLDK